MQHLLSFGVDKVGGQDTEFPKVCHVVHSSGEPARWLP